MAKKKKKNIFEKALDSVSNAFKPNKSSSSKPVATQAYTRASEKPVKKDTTPKKTETKKTSKPVAVQSYTRASERGTPTYNNTPAKKKVENKGIQTRRTTNVDSRTKTNTSKQTQDQHFMTRRNTNVDSRTGKNTARHGEWTPNEKGKATNVEVGAKNVQQAMAVLEQNKDYLKSTGQYDAMRNTIMHAAMRNTAGDAGLQMIRHSGFTEKEQKKLKANHDLQAFQAAPGSTAADKKLSVALTNAAKTVASGVEGATSGVFNAVTTVADSLERHIEGDKDKQQSQIDRLVSGKLTKTEEEMGLGKYKGNRKAAEQYVKNQDKKNKQNTKTATQMSDKYLEKAAADMQTAKDEADTKVGSFLTDVAIQGAKMGTETLLGGGAVGRMPVMAAEVFGQGVKEARDGGGTEAQQLAYGLTSAAIEYLSEQVFGVAGKVFGKGYADDIVENLAGRITSKFGRNATRYVLGAIGEGLEEDFSDLATPFAQMIYNGKSAKETKKDLFSKESLTNMLYDMALGTAMGAFGTTTQAFNGNFSAQDQALMDEIHSHRITDAKGNKIDRLEFAAQKMEQAQKKGQPISAKQIEKEWRKAYFNELTKNKTEIKKRMKNGLTRDEALAEMDEGVKWSDSEAYVSKWANRLTTNGVKTKEAVNADRVISRLIDAKGDSKAVSDAELKQVLNDLNITWHTKGKPRSNSGENSLAALRDRLGLDKVTVAGESWEYGPTQENRDYTVDQSHLIAAIRQGARAVGESKAQIVEDAAEDVETMTNQAKAEQQAIDDLKNRRIVVGDLGEQTFDQFSEQFKNNFPDATDDQLMTAWSKAVEQNGVPEEKAAAAFKPYEGEQTDMFPQMDNADYNDFVEEQRYLNPDITDEEIRKMWDERTEEQKQVRKDERAARDAGQLDMFDQMADESVRRQTLGLEPEEGRAAELKQSIKAIDDELSRYDNTETPEGIYVNKETGEEVPEETIERLKQNKEQLRTELMDIEPDEATTRERVFGIKQEEPVNEVEEIHKEAEFKKKAGLVKNESSAKLARETQDDINTLAGNIGYQVEMHDHIAPEGQELSLDIGVNGYIDKDNRVIHIAMDATDTVETLTSRILKVAAVHETSHGLETLAPEEYEEYCSYVEENWDDLTDGPDFETALKAKLEAYKKAKVDIDEEGARRELMAEFASHMDQDAIFNFVNSNPTLGQKIVQMFRDIVAKLREAFGSAGDMDTALRKWEKAYSRAVKDTARANRRSEVDAAYRGNIEVQNENGEPVAFMSEDGNAQLSIATYESEGREVLRQWLDKATQPKEDGSDPDLTEEDAKAIFDEMERIYQIAKTYADTGESLPFTKWSNAEVKKDKDGHTLLSVVTPNGEYNLNLDLSLVCKKRLMLDRVLDALIKKGIFNNMRMDQEDIVNINRIIVGHGFETECAICFVGAKRFRQAEIAQKFATQYNRLVKSMMPKGVNATYFNFGGNPELDQHNANVTTDVSTLPNDQLKLKKLQSLAKKKGKDGRPSQAVDSKIARYLLENPKGRHFVNRSDLMTTSGFEAMKAQNPDVLSLYNSKKGSGGPKASFGFAQYFHEMLNDKKFNPDAAYAVGGVRIQSFSDFVPRMFFDYAEIVGDLAAKQLPSHAYTKEEAFVKLFGLTGIKINMSLVPASVEGGQAPGLDAKGNYVWEKGQTFDYDTAVKIQKAKGYGDNCGTIAVGVSDAHIRQMMKDKNIRMIIPYHKSSLNPIVAAMNKISDFTDYTNYQNTRWAKTGKKIDPKEDAIARQEPNFNELLRKYGDDPNAPQLATEEYVRWCEDNNLLPKFDQFAYAQDENGEYIVEDGRLKVDENYYKLLEDFTLYNEEGKYVKQDAVQMNFPKMNDEETGGDEFGGLENILAEYLIVDDQMDRRQAEMIDSITDEIANTIDTPAVQERISKKEIERRQKHGDELRAAERQRYEEGLAKRRAAVQPNTAPKSEGAVQYSLVPVPPVKPTSDKWKYGASYAEVKAEHPDLFDTEGDTEEGANETQVDKTKSTYDKVFRALIDEGFTGSVLDASSGLGYGTEIGKAYGAEISKARGEENSFTVEDIEPYPNLKKHTPDYTDYSTLNKKYDFIISNAVLNVTPQDQRDALVVKMGQLLNDGGRMFINVRGKSDVRSATTKIPVNDELAEYYIPGSRSYQKGFSRTELKAYLEDALGEGFRVETKMGNFNTSGTTVLVYKDGKAPQYSLSFNKNIEDIDPTKPLKTLQGSTIKRAQNNVGKEIGGQIYVHKNYADDTKIPADVLAKGRELVPDDFEYNSVMWDKAKPNEIRFDEAPDFDTATEPQVGHFLKINTETGNITAGYSPNIWHHKWLWVKDDYDGFDTREAYDRSQTWLSQVKGTAKGTIKSWNKQLEENGMEPIDSEPVPKDQAFIDRFNNKPKGIFPTKEEADRMNGKAETPKVQSIPITDAMRESISTKGQPQFSLSSTRNADRVLGQNNTVPTEEEIKSGSATYGGLPIVYHPEMKADARNMDTEVWVSDKFFNDPDQQHILNHEVAHNLSDELMSMHTSDWQEFAANFIEEKQTPPSSSAYANGNRTYWEGLYGDIGATALSETTTRAITEYLDDPERLRQRSEDAYEVIDNFMRSREDNTQFSLSNESNKTNEQYKILFANLGLDLNASPMEFKKNKTPKQSKVVTNTYARTEVFDEAMEFIQDEEKKIEAKNAGRRLKENSEYDPISTREAMTQAKEALIDDYAGEKKRLLNTNEEWGSKELHEAMSIACTELANGNIKEFYKMGLRVKNKGTQGGQLVQAFKIYSKTPEGAAIQVLSNVEDKLGTIPPEVEEKVQDLAQQLRAIKDGDMDSIIEIIRRQAEIRKTPIGEHTLNQLRKETFQANYDRVYAQLMGIEDDARARNPAANSKTFWQKVSTWQLVSHLLNLRTGGRNLVSNTGFGGAETIANDLAMIPDYIISSVFGTGKRTVGFEYLSGAAVRAGFDRARGTAIDVKLDIDTERNRNKYGGTRRTWKMASSNPLAKGMSMAEMLLGYELNVTDEFAKGMHDYRIRSGLQKWADAGLITQEQVDMASEKEMLYRTFQDDTYPGMILNGIKNGLNVIGFGHTGRFTKYGGFEIKQFGVGDLVQKYTQVPGALLTRMVEYTPAGYAKMLYNIAAIKSTQKKVQQELTRASGERAKQLRQLDNDLFTYQREAALSFGRASTGSMIISMFFALAASGILHDEHSEEGDEQADKNAAAIRALQGISGTQLNWSALGRWIDKHDSKIEWQNGDKLIGIDFLEPFNGLMSIAATIAQDEYIMNDEYKGLYDKTTVMGQDMLHSLVNSFADVPTMQSIQNIQNAVRYHSKDSKYTVEFEVGLELLKGSITGFVPAPVRQVAQFQDDYYRDLYSQKDPFQQSADALRNSIPGLRQKLPEKLTPYGEPKEMEDKKQRALNAFVNPGKVTTFKQSELEKVLSAMDSNKLYPARNAPNKLDFGSERSLKPDEKRKYQEILGSTYTEEMTNLINTDAFKNASKGEQKDMLTEMKAFASKEGKAKIAAELKDDYSKTSEVNKILTVRSTGVALSDYNDFHVAACGVNSAGKLGSPSQGRAEAWIDSKGKELKLTNRQKRTLWMSCNKQWKEKNCPYPDNDDAT